MKINYEDIINKAHARTEALAKFQTVASAAEYHAVRILDSLAYFQSLRDAVMNLDPEGKEMLGEANSRVQNIGGRAKDMIAAFSSDGPDHLRLDKLVESLK